MIWRNIMKIFLLVLMVIASFEVFSNQSDLSSAQLIDSKGIIYGFGQTILVNKEEVKTFTITGLYNGFSASLRCEVTVLESCAYLSQFPSNKHKKSAYIIKSIINNGLSSEQRNFECGTYVDSNPKAGVICRVPGGSESPTGCKDNQVNLKNVDFFQVINGSSFTIINRPEFNLKFICTADGYN